MPYSVLKNGLGSKRREPITGIIGRAWIDDRKAGN